jgi:hypothetical protein
MKLRHSGFAAAHREVTRDLIGAVGRQCQAADIDLKAPAVGKFQFDRDPCLERWSVVADVYLPGAGSGNAGGIPRLLGLLLEILDNVEWIAFRSPISAIRASA